MRAGGHHTHPLIVLAGTFLTGATAGLFFLAGADWFNPEAAKVVLDLHGDGLDAIDAFAVMWVFGHCAIVIHHVFPGLMRD